MTPLGRVGHALAVGAKAAASFTMRFVGRSMTWSASFLGRTRINYAAEVGNGRSNSIVEAVVGWISRNFPEAPVVVRRQKPEGGFETLVGHAMVKLLERPNPFFSGVLLWMATIVDFCVSGNGYWIKVRNRFGMVVELWWIPSAMMAPKWPEDGSLFISHYEYKPDAGKAAIRLEPGDVVHFRDGIDPDNIRLGRSRLKSLLREIFTDDEAANFSASLLRNLGVPGVVIAPAPSPAGVSTIADPEGVKQGFMERFSGDRRGEPMVMTAPTDVKVLSFSPQQMNLKELRRLPEERVSAVYGVAAIVAGLGAGLDRSTFANFEEARQAAYEENIIPTQRMLSAELEIQLLPEFERSTDALTVEFDISNVRVLQEDQNKLWTRAGEAAAKGLITVRAFKDAVGQPTAESDDYYIRPFNTVEVPLDRGEKPELSREQAEAFGILYRAGVEPDAAFAALGLDPVEHSGLAPVTVQASFKAAAGPLRVMARRAVDVAREAMTRDVAAYFRGFAARILPKAKATPIDPDAINWKAEQEELSLILRRWYDRVGETAYESVDLELGLGSSDRAGLARIVEGIGERVTGITETSRNELKRVIADGIARGLTTDRIVAGDPDSDFTGLRALVESWGSSDPGLRAETIARTETATAYSIANVQAYRDSGLVDRVEVFDGDGCGWTTHDDGDLADGSIRTLDEAAEYPISHPNCIRDFAPVVEATASARLPLTLPVIAPAAPAPNANGHKHEVPAA